MRFFSSILFALMAMVLPMAGVEHYFCTTSMAFVDGADDCPVEKDECCGEKGGHKPAKPDCMIPAKLLPNAEKSSTIQIPTVSAWDFPLAATAYFTPSRMIEIVLPEADQSPPDPPRLYLIHSCLLI